MHFCLTEEEGEFGEEDSDEDEEDLESMRASQELALKFAESEDYQEVCHPYVCLFFPVLSHKYFS